ncbi:MAG TPA: hypothetical protein PK011_01155, partial [Marinagarivorans sp.]|nr:hypothetical protein [Marinagarivorans sp.]
LEKMRGFACFSAARGGLHRQGGIHAAIINPALFAAGLIMGCTNRCIKIVGHSIQFPYVNRARCSVD